MEWMVDDGAGVIELFDFFNFDPGTSYKNATKCDFEFLLFNCFRHIHHMQKTQARNVLGPQFNKGMFQDGAAEPLWKCFLTTTGGGRWKSNWKVSIKRCYTKLEPLSVWFLVPE